MDKIYKIEHEQMGKCEGCMFGDVTFRDSVTCAWCTKYAGWQVYVARDCDGATKKERKKK